MSDFHMLQLRAAAEAIGSLRDALGVTDNDAGTTALSDKLCVYAENIEHVNGSASLCCALRALAEAIDEITHVSGDAQRFIESDAQDLLTAMRQAVRS